MAVSYKLYTKKERWQLNILTNPLRVWKLLPNFLKISTWLKFQGLSIYHHSLDIAMYVLQIMV